ncbi:MAG: ABC transporter ATP-binding protein [Pseudoclavibacter sp.]
MTASIASLMYVTKRFGDVMALDDVSLEFRPGEIVGLLGPNGAGKTTAISLLQGLRAPTAGTVRVLGADPRDPRARQRLGSTPQETALPELFSVREALDFVGRAFADRYEPNELAARFGLEHLLPRRIARLSGGQRRQVSVALAFAGRPQLVLLDEPTTGLDVAARARLWEALRRQHDDGVTLVVSSHYLEEIQALASRVIVLDHGRMLADDTVSGVLAAVGRRTLRFATPRPVEVAAAIGLRPAQYTAAAGTMTAVVSDSDAVIRRLVDSGQPFHDLEVAGASLEDAFLAMTGGLEDRGEAGPALTAPMSASPIAPETTASVHPARLARPARSLPKETR